ncbi:DMT(drug/metabolite transporter) superfamily permease [Salinarchaeum sp. Harcht-Bsk1]|uniref:DMT family transporter n=1 Tax=Salinarchaeum sp. Harcht-Bsk1 TaxID=1333523 RepID=UPI0003424532|nr:DMT family transporter [Salinarchaeum sp. Harcht-Bsk1]AGN00010.1 DMT(drug/metabolite transporter) superfamily permease [Salinarchaeum sp. Harcht-Bsk1]
MSDSVGSIGDRLAGSSTSVPHLALAVAVVGVAWSAILIRWSDAPSDVIAFYRVLFTLLAVAPVALLRHRQAFGRIARRDVVVASVAGVALALHFLAWIESLAWTTVAASVTLVQTQPVFVALGAALVLDERVDRRTVAGIVVALFGASALTLVQSDASLPAGGSAFVGSTLAVIGAVAAAGYVLAGRSLRQRIPILPYVTVVYAACVATLFVAVSIDGATVVSVLRGDASAAGPAGILDAGAFVGYPAREWLLFLAMALGPGLLGHTVVNWTLEHLRSTVVSVALLGEPVGSTVLGVVLLDEVVGPGVVVSMAVVLAGIYVTATARANRDGEPEGVPE